jgi:hypothetical protein
VPEPLTSIRTSLPASCVSSLGALVSPPSPNAATSVPSNRNASAPPARVVSVSGTVSSGTSLLGLATPSPPSSKRDSTIRGEPVAGR